MEITNVKIHRLVHAARLRATASITLDNVLAIHNIRVIQGGSRLFVAMPRHTDARGEFGDIVHPIDKQFREELEAAVLEAYEKVRERHENTV